MMCKEQLGTGVGLVQLLSAWKGKAQGTQLQQESDHGPVTVEF